MNELKGLPLSHEMTQATGPQECHATTLPSRWQERSCAVPPKAMHCAEPSTEVLHWAHTSSGASALRWQQLPAHIHSTEAARIHGASLLPGTLTPTLLAHRCVRVYFLICIYKQKENKRNIWGNKGLPCLFRPGFSVEIVTRNMTGVLRQWAPAPPTFTQLLHQHYK